MTWPDKPAGYDDTCLPCEELHCNEWTKYSHPATGTVRTDGQVLIDGYYVLGAGLTEDNWVEAGDYLGVEGDVGQASGIHVHWEIVILNPNDPITGGGFSKDWTGGAWPYSPNLMPYICTGENGDIPPSPYVLYEGDFYDAQPCPELSAQEIADRRVAEKVTEELVRARQAGDDIAVDISFEKRERAIAELYGVLERLDERDSALKREHATTEIRDALEELGERDPALKLETR